MRSLASGRGVRGRGGHRHGVRYPAGLAHLPAARQHRPARPRRGVGEGGKTWEAGQVLPTTSSCSPPRGRAEEASPDRGDAGPARAAPASREDQDRHLTERAGGLRLPGLPPSDARVREVAGRWYFQKWPSAPGHGLHQGQGQRAHRRRFARPELRDVVGSSTPCCGAGGLLPPRKLTRKFATVDSYVHQRMAMLASNKHGLRGRNWATRFNYGWLTDLGIYRLSGTVATGLRMPDGERCRKAG